MAPEIVMPRDAELSDAIRATLSQLPPLNVFRMMAAVPASFQPFVDIARSVLVGGSFDPHLRELAILRVGAVTRASYEWRQHAAFAPKVGVTPDELAAVSAIGTVSDLTADQNLVCRVADEISLQVRLSNEALQALIDRFGNAGAAELILCVSYFNMLSRFLESTRVPFEKKAGA